MRGGFRLSSNCIYSVLEIMNPTTKRFTVGPDVSVDKKRKLARGGTLTDPIYQQFVWGHRFMGDVKPVNLHHDLPLLEMGADLMADPTFKMGRYVVRGGTGERRFWCDEMIREYKEWENIDSQDFFDVWWWKNMFVPCEFNWRRMHPVHFASYAKALGLPQIDGQYVMPQALIDAQDQTESEVSAEEADEDEEEDEGELSMSSVDYGRGEEDAELSEESIEYGVNKQNFPPS